MNLPLRKPYYRFEPIGSIDALARALGLESERLVAIAADADRLYRLAKPIVKSDGSIRQPLDALPALKTIHRRLKTRILAGVVYPEYLTGTYTRPARSSSAKTSATSSHQSRRPRSLMSGSVFSIFLQMWQSF
jgi:hypothetical protein